MSEVAPNATASDVGRGPNLDDALEGEYRRRIDHRWPQQLFGEIMVRTLEGGLAERALRPVKQHAASE